MHKLVAIVLALVAAAFADTQLYKNVVGSPQVIPSNAAYVAPLSAYPSGYAYPYQQYAHYPAGYNYASYPGYGYQGYQGYQGIVPHMPVAPVASAYSYPYNAQYVYQKPLAAATISATPASTAYSV